MIRKKRNKMIPQRKRNLYSTFILYSPTIVRALTTSSSVPTCLRNIFSWTWEWFNNLSIHSAWIKSKIRKRNPKRRGGQDLRANLLMLLLLLYSIIPNMILWRRNSFRNHRFSKMQVKSSKRQTKRIDSEETRKTPSKILETLTASTKHQDISKSTRTKTSSQNTSTMSTLGLWTSACQRKCFLTWVIRMIN